MVYIRMNLGQRPEKDEASRRYQTAEFAQVPIKSVDHKTHGRTSDQGRTSGCVGWTGRDWLMTDTAFRRGHSYGNPTGLRLYNGATDYDQWSDNDRAPNQKTGDPDEGSSILGLCKYMVKIGYARGYTWSFTLDQFLAGMQTRPQLLGITWYDGMFDPDSQGRIRPTGGVAGGHAIEAYRLDMGEGNPDLEPRVWIWNHWTQAWGIDGKAWMTLSDFDSLRKDQGEVADLIPAW